jgi:hypothetical protein
MVNYWVNLSPAAHAFIIFPPACSSGDNSPLRWHGFSGTPRFWIDRVLEEMEWAMSDSRVRGIVHLIEETKTYGQKGFRKRLVVLEQDNGRFTNYVPLDFTNDGCDSVDELHVGDEVEIAYRLSGRKWQKDPSSELKFFLNAEALSFKVLGQPATPNRSDVNDELSHAARNDDEVPF